MNAQQTAACSWSPPRACSGRPGRWMEPFSTVWKKGRPCSGGQAPRPRAPHLPDVHGQGLCLTVRSFGGWNRKLAPGLPAAALLRPEHVTPLSGQSRAACSGGLVIVCNSRSLGFLTKHGRSIRPPERPVRRKGNQFALRGRALSWAGVLAPPRRLLGQGWEGGGL